MTGVAMAVRILIDPEGPPDERLLAGQHFAAALHDEGVVVATAPTRPPRNAKIGGPAALGELILTGTLSTAAIAAVTRVIVAFAQRGHTVVIGEGTDRLEVQGVPAHQRKELVRVRLERDAGSASAAAPAADSTGTET